MLQNIDKNEVKNAANSEKIESKYNRASYARVSSGKEAMLHSLSAQVSYYSELIQNNPEWEYVGVYIDEAMTGTKDSRAEFQRMIEDCKAGKIDMIITKSISRFARNTVTMLEVVRKLKSINVDVYFEKENIYTFDSKGELLITIMSSLAQEESRSISENTTWGQRKRFADGKVNLPYKNFLGYEKGENDIPRIVEKEAKIVRLIYRLFLEGKTPSGIAKCLTEKKIPTPRGKEKWTTSTIRSILTNEKYKGDALLQKSYTVDFLTKKKKKNEGEVPQYYVENSHPAIISPEVFDMVQYEFEKRKGHVQSCTNCFSSKIVCGDCGSFYGSKVWHSNDKYRKKIWICNGKYKSGFPESCETFWAEEQLKSGVNFANKQNQLADDGATSRCNAKFKNKEKFKTPHVTEEQIKDGFINAVNSLIVDKKSIIDECEKVILELADTTLIQEKEIRLQGERDVIYNLLKDLVVQAAHPQNGACEDNEKVDCNVERELPARAPRTDQNEYNNKYESLKERYDKINEKLSKIESLKLEIKMKKSKAEIFIESLKRQSCLLTEFDERLWYSLIEKVIVNADGSMNFEFKNGKIMK